MMWRWAVVFLALQSASVHARDTVVETAVPRSAPSAVDLPIAADAIKSGRLYQAALMLDRIPVPEDARQQRELATLRAELTLASGDEKAAYAAFGALAALFPDDCTIMRGVGLAALQNDARDQAEVTLRRYATSCDADWRVWDGLAIALALDRRWEESVAAHGKAIELAPENPTVLNNAAATLIRQARFDEALVYLRRARVIAPDNVRIENNLDIALAASGGAPTRDVARDDAHRWAERLNNAGYAAMTAGRVGDARRLLTRSVQVDPTFNGRTTANLSRLEGMRQGP